MKLMKLTEACNLTDMHLQQTAQVESTSTDLTQIELRILWIRVNLKISPCYILLNGTGEMILRDNSLFPFRTLEQPNFATFRQFQVYTPWKTLPSACEVRRP